MDRDTGMRRRVGESSRKQPIQNKNPRNSSLSTATSGTPRKSQKRGSSRKTTAIPPEEKFYTARRILDEEYRDGTLHYLVDWADDEETGESYNPSWEPHHFCKPALIGEWQAKQRREREPRHRAPPTDSDEPDNDSQPIRPAKRRRVLSSPNPVAKGPRRASTEDRAESQEGVEVSEKEIPDSYEDDNGQVVSNGGGEFRVEVAVPKNFDSTAYTAYSISELSQPSQSLEPSTVAEASSDPVPWPSVLRTPARPPRLIFWDEDIEDEVPDSQEIGGSSSFKPLGTPTSKTDSTTKQNTQTNTEADLEAIEFRDTQWTNSFPKNSESIESQFAESAGYQSQEGYTETPAQTSARVQPSIVASSSDQETGIREDRPPRTVRYSEIFLGDSRPLSSAAGTETVSSGSSLYQSQPSSNLQPSQLFTQQSSSEDTQDPPHSQLILSSQPNPSSISSSGFLRQPCLSYNHSSGDQEAQDRSQLPQPSVEDIFGDERTQYQEVQSSEIEIVQDEDPGRVVSPVVQETESQTLAHESEQRASAQLTQRPFSNFTDRQTSKVISATPQPIHTVLQSSAVSTKGTQEDPIQIVSPQEETFPEPEPPTASQVHSDTQRSSSSKGSGSRSQLSTSTHLPSPPVEDVKPSIEEVGDFGSSPESSHPPSSPNGIPRRYSLFSNTNMEPITEPTTDPIIPASDPTALLKQKMAAKRAARASSSVLSSASRASTTSMSPSPGLSSINQQAFSTNQLLPVQALVEEIPAPAVQPSIIQQPVSPVLESAQHPLPIVSPQESPVLEHQPLTLSPTSLDIVPLGQNEYDVPLPLTSYTRDLYVESFKAYKSQLNYFLNDEVFDAGILKEVDSMLDILDQICSHLNLIEGEFSTQREESPTTQARWAENASTKCMFLAEFLPLMRQSNDHIIILVRPGWMVEVLQTLLQQHGICHCRADQPGWRSVGTSLVRVTLYPTGTDTYLVERPSLVIAFDSTSRTWPYLKELRTDPTFPDRLIPLFSLVVANSIEHLERCFGKNLEPVDRKIKLVTCIAQLMGRVGMFDEAGYHDPPDAAKAMAEFLNCGSNEGSWSLLPMPEIEGLDLSHMSSQPFSDEQPTASSESYNMHSSAQQVLQPGVKRQLDAQETFGTDSPKRQRMTPVPGEMDSLHANETMLGTFSAPAGPKLSKLVTSEQDGVDALRNKVNYLESRLREKETIEMQLREINQDLEARCKDYESSIASIQPKYQEALNERGNYEHENNLVMLREVQLKKQRDNKDAEVIKLREKNTAIEAELTAVRLSLSTSAIPQAAELAQLKDEIEKSKTTIEQLQKRNTSISNDLEYVRSTYQTASSAAVESHAELRDLQSELTSFRDKAKIDRVRIHEIQAANEISELRQSNSLLKSRVEELEWAFEKQGEELKALMNGRRGNTRGTSVPRSPRMGGGANQMSPGPRTSTIGRVLQIGASSRSRGNSPAPGEVGAGGVAVSQFSARAGSSFGFGEALFQGPAASGRWGNHLQ